MARGQNIFAACDRRAELDLAAPSTAKCYYDFLECSSCEQGDLKKNVLRKLEGLLRSDPGAAYAHLYRAFVLYLLRDVGFEAAAAEALASLPREDTWNQIRLQRLIARRSSDALVHLERAESIATDDWQRWMVEIELARLVANSGGPWAAYHERKRLREEIHRIAGEDPATYRVEARELYYRDLMVGLARDLFETNQLPEAHEIYRELVAYAETTGCRRLLAEALYGQGNTLQEMMRQRPQLLDRHRLLEIYTRALDAVDGCGLAIEAQLRLALLRLTGGSFQRQPEEQFEACIKLARNDTTRAGCRVAYAHGLLQTDSATALGLAEESLRIAAASERPWALLYSWAELDQVFWESYPTEKALAFSLEMLRFAEAVFDSQFLGGERAALLEGWSDRYHWLADRLLARGELEPAFEVMERMSARVLHEVILAGRPERVETPATSTLRDGIEDEIRLRRRLLAGEDSAAITGPLGEIDDLRNREWPALAPQARLLAGQRPSLDEVRQGLRPGQALLRFHIGGGEDRLHGDRGGSWLLVVTAAGTEAIQLDIERGELEQRVADLQDIAATDLATVQPAFSFLYEQLLEQALGILPDGIESLVFVPDGILHLLPLRLLGGEGEPPLGARFEVSVQPSAALWWHFRQKPDHVVQSPALVLADPVLEGIPSETRVWMDEQDLDLGPLPFAGKEGRGIRRLLGADLRLGAAASERFLKTADLSGQRILHLAAHAVANETDLGRSAILLSPGDPAEDGRLTPQEILRLPLDSKLVVLSACSTGAGGWIRGEGVMSLARYFFQAGAQTVVVSLKPLDDASAAGFFVDVYRQLARGASISAALHEVTVRRHRLDKKLTWGVVEVLGNGDFVPFPGGIERPARWGWWAWGALPLAVFSLWALRQRRRPATQ